MNYSMIARLRTGNPRRQSRWHWQISWRAFINFSASPTHSFSRICISSIFSDTCFENFSMPSLHLCSHSETFLQLPAFVMHFILQLFTFSENLRYWLLRKKTSRSFSYFNFAFNSSFILEEPVGGVKSTSEFSNVRRRYEKIFYSLGFGSIIYIQPISQYAFIFNHFSLFLFFSNVMTDRPICTPCLSLESCISKFLSSTRVPNLLLLSYTQQPSACFTMCACVRETEISASRIYDYCPRPRRIPSVGTFWTIITLLLFSPKLSSITCSELGILMGISSWILSFFEIYLGYSSQHTSQKKFQRLQFTVPPVTSFFIFD